VEEQNVFLSMFLSLGRNSGFGLGSLCADAGSSAARSFDGSQHDENEHDGASSGADYDHRTHDKKDEGERSGEESTHGGFRNTRSRSSGLTRWE